MSDNQSENSDYWMPEPALETTKTWDHDGRSFIARSAILFKCGTKLYTADQVRTAITTALSVKQVDTARTALAQSTERFNQNFIDDVQAALAAVSTLQSLGYTYNGGERWKPPLGKNKYD